MRSTKHQHSSIREASMLEPQEAGVAWGLKLPWSLDFGCWSFFRRRQTVSLAPRHQGGEGGSAFIIVLWIAFGLVSLALYFGNSMVMELRAADNRVSGLGAEQAIEGGVRYVNGILGNYAAYGSN